jgi:urease accessory protein
MIRRLSGLCGAAVMLVPSMASAHVVAGASHGFAHGFSHPFSGIDHVLAMTAIGLFAVRLGGRALWLVPVTFVCVMALAGVAGMAGVTVAFVDIGVAMTVVVLGLTLAAQLSVSTTVAALLVGFFAIFHGYAHGAEMPENISALSYGLGFICATALLQALGVGLGLLAGLTGPDRARRMVQIGGVATAIAGAVILGMA